jgi:hypothetical protein
MIEKVYVEKSYPESHEGYTQELIGLIKEYNKNAEFPIELIRIDSPVFEFEGERIPVETERAMELSQLVNKIVRFSKKGATRLYLLHVEYKYDKLCVGEKDYIFADTFYVRWRFKN